MVLVVSEVLVSVVLGVGNWVVLRCYLVVKLVSSGICEVRVNTLPSLVTVTQQSLPSSYSTPASVPFTSS